MPCLALPESASKLARCGTLRGPPRNSHRHDDSPHDNSSRDDGAPPSGASDRPSIPSSAYTATDILAMSPSRLSRPQIDVVEAQLPYMLANLDASGPSANTGGGDACPPLIHSWMSKCIDGAAGRDARAEKMCLAVRQTFRRCSQGSA